MREITMHVVQGDTQPQLVLTAVDEPGSGGANHEYEISVPDMSGVMQFISFQNGPIKEVGINGVSNEVLLAVVIDRIEAFQNGEFACDQNAQALLDLRRGLFKLQQRTRDRVARGVEGESKA